MKNITKVDNSEANAFCSSLIGEYVWFVRYGEDDILRLEFGEPHLMIREPQHNVESKNKNVLRALSRRTVVPTGRWSLFIEDGLWEVMANNLQYRYLDIDKLNLNLCLNGLSGQKVTKISVYEGNSSLQIYFDIDGVLSVSNNIKSVDSDQWVIFMEKDKLLSCTSEGEFIIESF